MFHSVAIAVVMTATMWSAMMAPKVCCAFVWQSGACGRMVVISERQVFLMCLYKFCASVHFSFGV